jgi:hypothetical protein
MFSWLVLHGKILTADRLAIRGWPHDPICQLCLRAPETACHLYKDCPFTSQVWNLVHAWSLDDCPRHSTQESINPLRLNTDGARQARLASSGGRASSVPRASSPAILQVTEMQRIGIEDCDIDPSELTEERLLEDRATE